MFAMNMVVLNEMLLVQITFDKVARPSVNTKQRISILFYNQAQLSDKFCFPPFSFTKIKLKSNNDSYYPLTDSYRFFLYNIIFWLG